jgi:hypothetical protein
MPSATAAMNSLVLQLLPFRGGDAAKILVPFARAGQPRRIQHQRFAKGMVYQYGPRIKAIRIEWAGRHSILDPNS